LCRELLTRGERRLNDQFVELERQLLERSLKRSPGAASEPPHTSPGSPWDQPPPMRKKELPVPSGSRMASVDDPNKLESRKQEARSAARPEWWTMGQNALMDGALASLAESYKPLYDSTLPFTKA
jgi:hypothetical protein